MGSPQKYKRKLCIFVAALDLTVATASPVLLTKTVCDNIKEQTIFCLFYCPLGQCRLNITPLKIFSITACPLVWYCLIQIPLILPLDYEKHEDQLISRTTNCSFEEERLKHETTAVEPEINNFSWIKKKPKHISFEASEERLQLDLKQWRGMERAALWKRI